MSISWNAATQLSSKKFSCGHCNTNIASQIGFIGNIAGQPCRLIYICHECGGPNDFGGRRAKSRRSLSAMLYKVFLTMLKTYSKKLGIVLLLVPIPLQYYVVENY